MFGDNILRALLVFLVGALTLAIVVYICNLIIGLLTLPAAVAQIALLIIGLVGLLALVMLVVNVYRGGGGAL